MASLIFRAKNTSFNEEITYILKEEFIHDTIYNSITHISYINRNCGDRH